jgi:hypothetical protein
MPPSKRVRLAVNEREYIVVESRYNNNNYYYYYYCAIQLQLTRELITLESRT